MKSLIQLLKKLICAKESGKNMKKMIVATTIALSSYSALATTGVCYIADQPLPANINMSSQEIQDYSNKLKSECDLSLRAMNVSLKLEERGAPIEMVTQYQAMRFVRTVNYNESKMAELPIEKTYQIKKENYSLPVGQRSTVIWDNWIEGIKSLEKAKFIVFRGNNFKVDDLKTAHIGFFQKSDEVGDYAHAPDKGVFKPVNEDDNYWWDFRTSQESLETQTAVSEINAFYRKIGLVDITKPSRIYNVLRVGLGVPKQLADGTKSATEVVDAIYGGDSRANMEHVNNILEFMNTTLQQGLAGKHMVYKGRLFTPAEVAFLTQQFYVQVHPFSEGNGRTSRLMQELILTTLGLPHGSSGDLMDIDVLTPFPKYYRTAMDSTANLVSSMQSCLEEYKTLQLKTRQRIYDHAGKLDYNCRLLKLK